MFSPAKAQRREVLPAFDVLSNRDLKFIFQDRATELYVSFLGNHDEIRALLRRGAYR